MALYVCDLAVDIDEIAVYSYTENFNEKLFVYEAGKPVIENGIINGTFTLSNRYNNDKKFTMVVAAYDAVTSELIGCDLISGIASAGEITDAKSYSVGCKEGTVGAVKLILLDGIDTIVPYDTPTVFKY